MGVRRVRRFRALDEFEVFLVSQIKEHADAGEDLKRSVVPRWLGKILPRISIEGDEHLSPRSDPGRDPAASLQAPAVRS